MHAPFTQVASLLRTSVPGSSDAIKYLGISVLCSTLLQHVLAGKQLRALAPGDRALPSQTAVRLLNRILVAAFVKLTVEQVSAVSDTVNGQGGFSWTRWDARERGEDAGLQALLLGYLPINAWPAADNFLAGLMVVVVTGTVYKVAHCLVSGSLAGNQGCVQNEQGQGLPGLLEDELQQVVRSVQFAFADTATSLLSEPRAATLLAVAGLMCMPLLRDLQAGAQPVQAGIRPLVVGGLSMAWINVVVGTLTSGASEGGGAGGAGLVGIITNSVTSLAVALLFQSACNILPGTEVLQSYLEWSVANSVSGAVQVWGNRQGLLYLGLLSFAVAMIAPQLAELWGLLAAGGRGGGASAALSSKVSTRDTVVHVASTVGVNSMTKYVVDTIAAQSTLDTIVATVAGIVGARNVLHVYTHVAKTLT